jgi:hypothetical protein
VVRALAWSNSATSSIDVLCYRDWFFSLSFGMFQGFSGIFLDFLNVYLSSLFIVGEPPHRVYLDPDSNSKR